MTVTTSCLSSMSSLRVFTLIYVVFVSSGGEMKIEVRLQREKLPFRRSSDDRQTREPSRIGKDSRTISHARSRGKSASAKEKVKEVKMCSLKHSMERKLRAFRWALDESPKIHCRSLLELVIRENRTLNKTTLEMDIKTEKRGRSGTFKTNWKLKFSVPSDVYCWCVAACPHTWIYVDSCCDTLNSRRM